MSYRLVNAIFKLKFTALEKSVLGAMLSHVKDDGMVCKASAETLACESGGSIRSVHRTILSFEKRNIVESLSTKKRDHRGGRNEVTHYRILIPNLDIVTAIESTWTRNNDKVAEYAGDANSATVTQLDSKQCQGAEKQCQGAVNSATMPRNSDKVALESVIESVFESVPESVKKESSSRSRDTDSATFRVFLNAWQVKNGSPLHLGKNDRTNLHKLIIEHGEAQVYFGWLEFITADPAPYRTTALEIPRERMSKAGRAYTETVNDESAITKFPLSVFLKTPESYLLAGENTLAKNKTGKAPLEWARTIYGLR